jgi:hypothetical protein
VIVGESEDAAKAAPPPNARTVIAAAAPTFVCNDDETAPVSLRARCRADGLSFAMTGSKGVSPTHPHTPTRVGRALGY